MHPLISEQTPLIGVEPSAILTFRDEYIDLADDNQLEAARKLATNVFLIDEFIADEIAKGYIKTEQFTTEKKKNYFTRALPAKSLILCDSLR